MIDKLAFKHRLDEVLEEAKKQGGKITSEEVEKYFQEEALLKEQMELVYDYLLSQKIAVRGYTKQGGRVQERGEVMTLSQEEKEYLEEYLQDLSAMKAGTREEELRLAKLVYQGDSLSKSRLTELYLKKVVEVGEGLNHPEIFMGDLIQEGNVSLMLALESLPDVDEVGLEEVESYIMGEIRQGMQMLIEETVELKSRDQKMVQKVTDLDEGITKLTEELGRKVTIEELSIYMEVSEEEILEIMKLTGEDGEEEKNS